MPSSQEPISMYARFREYCLADSLFAVVPKRWRPLAGIALTAFTLYLCIRCCFYAIFIGFYVFDDEGAMVLVLSALSKGHKLYDQVPVMYGPIGFLPKVAILKILHLSVNHNISRAMSATLMYFGCVGAGIVSWRITKEVGGFVIGTFTTFFLLRTIGSESGHPQDVCQMLIVLAGFAATFADQRSIRTAYLILALIGGFLVMTKGNLGFLYLAAFITALAMKLKRGRMRTMLTIASAIIVLAIPYVLLYPHLEVVRIYRFLISIECTIASCFIIVLARRRDESLSVTNFLLLLGAFAGTAGAIVIATLAIGTSVHGLMDGLIVLPLRASKLLISPWRQTEYMIPMGMTAVALSLIAATLISRKRIHHVYAGMFSLIKIAFGLTAILSIWLGRMDGQDFALATTSQAIWLLLIPVEDAEYDKPPSSSRVFLAFLAVMEILGSYPNAGAQQSIGQILPICISIVCVFDGSRWLTMYVQDKSIKLIQFGFHASLVLSVLVLAAMHELKYAEEYRIRPALPFAGSTMVHVFPDQLADYCTVVDTLKANSDSFMTVPGMNSFYFWAGMAPPTECNMTNWLCLTDQQQKENYAALQSARRPCVLFNPHIANFWNNAIPTAMEAPIIQWINRDYKVLLTESNWVFLFPKERSFANLVQADNNHRQK